MWDPSASKVAAKVDGEIAKIENIDLVGVHSFICLGYIFGQYQ